jgi:hypothetical protein
MKRARRPGPAKRASISQSPNRPFFNHPIAVQVPDYHSITRLPDYPITQSH